MSELALVIENDEDLANIFTEALRSVGFDVEQVADGRTARHRLQQGTPPYLILLDMHLPHISGADLLTNLLKKDARFSDTIRRLKPKDRR
jgi:DNA-binding response OmpR family regulator